jgi:hypothetical protein
MLNMKCCLRQQIPLKRADVKQNFSRSGVLSGRDYILNSGKIKPKLKS